MQQFHLAVATRCFVEPLLLSLKSAADLNVQGVQFDIRNEVRSAELTETGRRDLLHQLSEHGLKVASTTFPLNHPLYEQDRIDVRVAAIREAMKFAYLLKAPTLCIRVGRIPSEEQVKDRALLIEVLSDLARHANHVGTVIAVTPTNDTADQLRSLIEQIKTGPIGIDFDPAHFAMTGRSVSESLRALHNLVMHVQLRDGVHGIDGGQEETVGHGNVDWAEVLALLGEMDYRGWMTAIRNQGDDRPTDLVRALKYVRKMLLGG